MKTGERGITLIKSFEGCKLASYRDSVGILTIGFGHTGPDVHPEMTVTEEEADAMLRDDLRIAENCVNRATNGTVLTQQQFDALVSFVFNLGCSALHRSTLLAKLLDGDDDGASVEFARWNKAGGKVLAGLTRRREAEAELFRTVA